MLLIIPSIALADQLYDKGRSYGTFLGGSNMSMEMNVVSASANCSVSGYLYGVERVRAWARTENLQKIYPTSAGYACGISGSQVRLYSDDSRRSSMFITGMNPPDSSSSSPLLLV
ncbi:MAG: hypothetical protein C0594_00670, partial [Marinilabiliales bacterium]